MQSVIVFSGKRIKTNAEVEMADLGLFLFVIMFGALAVKFIMSVREIFKKEKRDDGQI
jgi:hypothetical protein